MRFSLVIPCHNEAANLPLLLPRCKEVTRRSDIEVILVDNGSTDNSPDIFLNLLPQYPGCRSVRIEENNGYGCGVLTGLRAARGEILGWTHADMQADPQDALRGLELFEKHGLDIFVKGRRYGRPLGDLAFTVGMSVFETLLFGKSMCDINAQPTMFSRTFFDTWIEPPYDDTLDLYAYYQARCKRLKIHRFPVRFGKRAYGVSHWNVNWAGKRKFIHRIVNSSLKLKKRIKT
jgi:glycosyltransferase involved in cell wall biosynthesis